MQGCLQHQTVVSPILSSPQITGITHKICTGHPKSQQLYTHIYEYYSSIEKNEMIEICMKMDAVGKYYSELSQSQRQTCKSQLVIFICMYHVTSSMCGNPKLRQILTSKKRSIKRDEWEWNRAHNLEVEEGILGKRFP